MILSEIKDTILHIIFPPVCLSCERDIKQGEKDILCSKCLLNLKYIKPPYCRICGISIDGGEICYKCKKRERKFNFKFSRSVFMYNREISSVIIAYKYQKKEWLWRWLGDKMIEAFNNYPEFKNYRSIVYTPISKKKFLSRGFNQTEIIAKYISQKFGLELIEDAVVKIKDTESQVNLDATKRNENVKGSFVVKKTDSIKNKNIIIIDDVATTMSTLNEIAGVLKEAGALNISCYTIARE